MIHLDRGGFITDVSIYGPKFLSISNLLGDILCIPVTEAIVEEVFAGVIYAQTYWLGLLCTIQWDKDSLDIACLHELNAGCVMCALNSMTVKVSSANNQT